MVNKIAIIIPAYKSSYLHETLQSISNQTCKNFTVYIGDDASPNELYKIVEKFSKEIDIVFKRFDTNLGGHNLIAQWERCIEMITTEEWIWLFSDDDIMAPNCIELFYRHVEFDKKSQLLHFNTHVIDSKGVFLGKSNPFPKTMTSKVFFEKRIRSEIHSFAVEYIFSKNIYKENDGFEFFDLAWCSDDATWVKFAKNTNISTIDKDSLVYWRYSGENISSLNVDESILIRKLNARISYLNWANDFFKENKEVIEINSIHKVKWILLDIFDTSYLGFYKSLKYGYKYSNLLGDSFVGILGAILVVYEKSKSFIKKKARKILYNK